MAKPLGGVRTLTGRPDDYKDSVGAVGRCILQLLHEYEHAGGDLGHINISVTAAGDGQIRGTVIELDGLYA